MEQQFEQDVKNVEAVFALARKEVALDEQQLIELINLKVRVLKSLEVAYEASKEEIQDLKVEK